jgi:hypothetical protein
MNYGQCRCGFYHYTVEHYQEIHGQSQPYLDPYVQAPFAKGELWNEQEYNQTEPYPTISWEWICQFCGNKANDNHQEDCSYWENAKELLINPAF